MKDVSRSRHIVGSIVAICIAIVSTTVYGQTSSSQPEMDSKSTRLTETQAKDLTAYYASRLFLANQFETELAKIATTRASQPELQRFAKTLHHEHVALAESLRSMIPSNLASNIPAPKQVTKTTRSVDRGSDDEDDLFDDEDSETDGDDEKRITANRVSYTEISDPVLRKVSEVERGLVASRIRNASAVLNRLQGTEFDMAFISHKVHSHENLLAELNAINGIGSTDFQSLVTRTKRMLNTHLISVRNLAESIKSNIDDAEIDDEIEDGDEVWEDDGDGDDDNDDGQFRS